MKTSQKIIGLFVCLILLSACGEPSVKKIESDVFVVDHSTIQSVWQSAEDQIVASVQNPWGTNIVQGENVPQGDFKVARTIHVIVVTDNTADRDPIEIMSGQGISDVWDVFISSSTNATRANELYDSFMAEKNSFWADKVAEPYLQPDALVLDFDKYDCESALENSLQETKYLESLDLLDSETGSDASDVSKTFCGFVQQVRDGFGLLHFYRAKIEETCPNSSACSDIPGAIEVALSVLDDAASDESRSNVLSDQLGYSMQYAGCIYFASDMTSAASSLTKEYLQLGKLIRRSNLDDAEEMSNKAKDDLLDDVPNLFFEINVYMPSIGVSKSSFDPTDKQQGYLEAYWQNFFDESGFDRVETGSSSTACSGDEWSRQ